MGLLDGIGQTPLVSIEGIFVKLECANAGGSIKDRIAKFMLLEAQRRGDLKPGDVIVEATSGNTGIALAMVGREIGHRVMIFMPEHMSAERREMMERMGAEVRLTSREGSFAGACEQRDEFLNRPGYFVPDQFGNPDNTRCHETTTGPELIAQARELGAPRLDAFVAGVGTGGTLMGVGRALRAAFPELRVIAVEPTESAVMSGGEAGDHGIMGIGDGFIPALIDSAHVSGVEQVSTEEATAEAARIRREWGHSVGVSAGANLIAAARLRDRGMITATVFSDCSDRYGSVGLESTHSAEVTCPQRGACRARSTSMLGE
jgi:cysteine synthase A